MVVLAPGREIGPEDIPQGIRQGGAARLLPVRVGPAARATDGLGGRELEFILRNLVELKLQVEELRRRMDEERSAREQWVGELRPGQGYAGLPTGGVGAAWGIEPRDQPPPPNVVTVTPGMTMAEIERLSIEAALKETRGNRRKAADLLGIGERTLYRKLREYALDTGTETDETSLGPDESSLD
jgi:DNA-binding NtrC family response regulator